MLCPQRTALQAARNTNPLPTAGGAVSSARRGARDAYSSMSCCTFCGAFLKGLTMGLLEPGSARVMG